METIKLNKDQLERLKAAKLKKYRRYNINKLKVGEAKAFDKFYNVSINEFIERLETACRVHSYRERKKGRECLFSVYYQNGIVYCARIE